MRMNLDECRALFEKESTKERDAEIGESLALRAAEYGKLAAAFLFRSQWAYAEPEWFDHRLHLLDPETHFTDFWTMSADNVLRVLPFNGRLLDLCSGDGFYSYRFFRLRADVTCVELNPEAHAAAVRNHAHPRIKQVFGDALTYEAHPGYYDVVLIRGAIEHFTEENQQKLFRKSWDALKDGGYVCGDTVAARVTPAEDGALHKQLSAHEHEWRTESEMREALAHVFNPKHIETWTLYSEFRTSLFWRCRKL